MDKNIKTAIKVLALVGLGYRIGKGKIKKHREPGVFEKVVIPGLKKVATDAISYEITTLVFGKQPKKIFIDKLSHSDFDGDVIDLSKLKCGPPYRKVEPREPKFNIRYQQKSLIINTSEDAANILNTLMDSAKKYGTVAVADYYDMCGIAPEFTDNNFGWTAKMVERAYLVPYNDGIKIILPDPERLTELGGK